MAPVGSRARPADAAVIAPDRPDDPPDSREGYVRVKEESASELHLRAESEAPGVRLHGRTVQAVRLQRGRRPQDLVPQDARQVIHLGVVIEYHFLYLLG